MYVPKYFQIPELFPKEFYEKNKNKANQLLFLHDNRALWTLDRIRKRYGKVLMNTWYWGGQHQYRGWRPFNCKIGAELSQHKWGRADDLEFTEITAEEVRRDILKDPFDADFIYITSIEKDVSWLHFDVRNWNKKKNGILII